MMLPFHRIALKPLSEAHARSARSPPPQPPSQILPQSQSMAFDMCVYHELNVRLRNEIQNKENQSPLKLACHGP